MSAINNSEQPHPYPYNPLEPIYEPNLSLTRDTCVRDRLIPASIDDCIYVPDIYGLHKRFKVWKKVELQERDLFASLEEAMIEKDTTAITDIKKELKTIHNKLDSVYSLYLKAGGILVDSLFH